MMIKVKLILISLFGLTMSGCSMTRMAANQTTSILVRAMPAYDRETHLEFAEQAIAGNLKLLEGLLERSHCLSLRLLEAQTRLTLDRERGGDMGCCLLVA